MPIGVSLLARKCAYVKDPDEIRVELLEGVCCLDGRSREHLPKPNSKF